MKLEYYNNDGANYQVQIVAILLREREELIFDSLDTSRCIDYNPWRFQGIQIGRYENGREQGYVFTFRYFDKQYNYAVYEHRNCDDICVIVNEARTSGTPTNVDMGAGIEGKYDEKIKRFSYGAYATCASWIGADLADRLRKEIA